MEIEVKIKFFFILFILINLNVYSYTYIVSILKDSQNYNTKMDGYNEVRNVSIYEYRYYESNIEYIPEIINIKFSLIDYSDIKIEYNYNDSLIKSEIFKLPEDGVLVEDYFNFIKNFLENKIIDFNSDKLKGILVFESTKTSSRIESFDCKFYNNLYLSNFKELNKFNDTYYYLNEKNENYFLLLIEKNFSEFYKKKNNDYGYYENSVYLYYVTKNERYLEKILIDNEKIILLKNIKNEILPYILYNGYYNYNQEQEGLVKKLYYNKNFIDDIIKINNSSNYRRCLIPIKVEEIENKYKILYKSYWIFQYKIERTLGQ